jgi:hypothetical protein
MTKLEERQFDRYCTKSDDPCEALRQAARQAIVDARIKMNEMSTDKGGMFGTGRWDTHAAGVRGRIANIYAIISLGLKLGCDMSTEIALAKGLSVPNSPIRIQTQM